MNRRRPTGLRPRRSLLRPLLAVLGAGGLAAAMAWGGWRAHRHLTTSERYAVRQLVFTGLSRATQPDLVDRAGLVAGASHQRAMPATYSAVRCARGSSSG